MIIVRFIHMDSIHGEIAASTRAADNLRNPMARAKAIVVDPVDAINTEDTRAEETAMVHNRKIYIIKIRAISSSLNNRRITIWIVPQVRWLSQINPKIIPIMDLTTTAIILVSGSEIKLQRVTSLKVILLIWIHTSILLMIRRLTPMLLLNMTVITTLQYQHQKELIVLL